jgi:hypothetical protein
VVAPVVGPLPPVTSPVLPPLLAPVVGPLPPVTPPVLPPFVSPATRTTEVPQAASAVNNENVLSRRGARIAKFLRLIRQVILRAQGTLKDHLLAVVSSSSP